MPWAGDKQPALRHPQFFVCAIAERRAGSLLALAPPDGGFFGDLEFHRGQAGSFVGTIAKGLLGRSATSAPPVGACFDFKGQRFCITDDWFFSHGRHPSRYPAGVKPLNCGMWPADCRQRLGVAVSPMAVSAMAAGAEPSDLAAPRMTACAGVPRRCCGYCCGETSCRNVSISHPAIITAEPLIKWGIFIGCERRSADALRVGRIVRKGKTIFNSFRRGGIGGCPRLDRLLACQPRACLRAAVFFTFNHFQAHGYFQ